MINSDGILNSGNYLIGPGDSLKHLIYGPIKLVRNYILLQKFLLINHVISKYINHLKPSIFCSLSGNLLQNTQK